MIQFLPEDDQLIVRCKQGCKKHILKISPSPEDGSKDKSNVELKLCPVTDKKKQVIQNVWPVFNKNGKYYQPSFIIECDWNAVLINHKKWQNFFRKRVNEKQRSLSQIFIPHPGKNSCYCGVCKCIYEDYASHIDSKAHKQKIKKSKFQPDIKELCMSYMSTSMKMEEEAQNSYTQKLRSFTKKVESRYLINKQKIDEQIKKEDGNRTLNTDHQVVINRHSHRQKQKLHQNKSKCTYCGKT